MIVEIVPLARLPRKISSFSYLVPKKLEAQIKIGQIIEINLRNKKTNGLVVEIKNKNTAKFKLKEINKIILDKKIITNEQISLIKFISEYYGVAQSIVAKSLVPDVPKKTLRHGNTKTREHICKKNKRYNKKIFWYEKKLQAIELVKKSLQKNKNGQILILVPEKVLIDRLVEYLKLDDKEVFKCYSGVAKVKYFKNWLEILNNKKKIIIGTKISVLLPFANLQEIFVWDSEDWNHKQSDINPRFDARRVAEWLAEKFKCRLTFLSCAPGVEKYTGTLKHLNTKTQNEIKVIDLKQEKLKGNYSFLSDELIYNMQAVLTTGKKVFVLHNRKGLANYIFCNDCQHVFKCNECELSLIYNSAEKKLICTHCGGKFDIPPLCPKCSGSDIKFKGQGIEKIKLEIQKEFKNEKILVLEKINSLKSLKALKNYSIVIGTEFAVNKINFSEFDLVAFTNFDQLLNHADFRATEKAYQLFNKIKSESEAVFLIQTSSPENFVIQSILKNKPELFYKTELTTRREFNYPPFKKLIKIFYFDKSEAEVNKKSKALVNKLENKFKNQIEILGPLENVPKKVRGKYKLNIILKIPLAFDAQQIFNLIPNDFLIDVEVEHLNT